MMQGLEKLEPVNRETTVGAIATQIRSRIMDGTFPAESQLNEARLATRLNVSRGPVREALQRLVQEGLLENRRNRGVFVISLGEEDIADVYLARGTIERAAALIIMRRADTQTCERLDNLVERMSLAAKGDDWASCADLDLQFHETMVRSTDSKRLQRMYNTLLAETRMCLAVLETAYPLCKDLVEEHRALVDAIRKRDEPKVLQAVNTHLKTAVRDLTERDGYTLGL